MSAIKTPHKYYYTCCGIGKVASAVETLNLILSYDLDMVVVVGFAAGTSNFELGEVVIPQQARYSDVHIPEEIHHLVVPLIKTYSLQGEDDVTILTADSFITKEMLSIVEGGQYLFDMESAAVSQVCDDSEIPVLVVKVVSDRPEIDSVTTFEESCQKYKDFSRLALIIEAYLS